MKKGEIKIKNEEILRQRAISNKFFFVNVKRTKQNNRLVL